MSRLAGVSGAPSDVSAQGLTGCVIESCGKKIVGRGRCRRHYAQWWRATPKSARTPAHNLKTLTPEQRFHAKVNRRGDTECWPWTASAYKFGHGEFFVSRERGRVPAHSYALELAIGRPCPPGLETCHRCDNPPCCNPAHLYFGTRKQNVADAFRRNRMPVGEARTQAKLDFASVKTIRERYAAGETQPSLAAEFQISPALISRIINGRVWVNAPGPIQATPHRGRRFRKVA